MEPLSESNLNDLELISRGKVRDIYRVDAERLLIVASDRISAFDVILPDPVPGKGIVLTAISNFWFGRLAPVIGNHLTGVDPASVVSSARDIAQIEGRSVVVRALKPLPIEAVVRGYLIGSGWKDYCRTGQVSGIELPAGLELGEQLPEPVFTPSTKAPQGAHDENISMNQVRDKIGADLSEQVAAVSLALYHEATRYAADCGLLIGDTKFEFGLDEAGKLVLIDEVLTPDSSRFWPAEGYEPGASPPSFDKQYVRDYLETLEWNKQPPGPCLPTVVIERTREKYHEALARLTGRGTAAR